MRQANERLNAYQRERHGPTIVVAQGSYDAKQVRRKFWRLLLRFYLLFNMIATFTQWRFKIPMLQDFPLATIPANSLDEMLPAVGWQVSVRSRTSQIMILNLTPIS
jgi:hypothetical protein